MSRTPCDFLLSEVAPKSDFRAGFPSSQSGQVVVEYILIMTVMVSIIMGVFWSVLERRVEEMKATMETRLQQVISQDTLGIPMAWFGLDAPNAGVVRFEPGGAGEDPPAEEEPPEEDDDEEADADGGEDGPGGPGGRGGRRGRGAGSPTSPSSSSEGPDSPGGGRSGGAGSGGQQNPPPPGNRQKQDGQDSQRPRDRGGDEDFEGGVSTDQRPQQEQKDDAGPAGKPGAPGEVVVQEKQRLLFGRKVEAEGDGCGDMDLFMLLKLGAFVAILLLFFAVMVTAKGQKGD